MGISGLLPLLKSIQKHVTLKQFAGQTLGIDAFGWLHRGTVACASELALDKPTSKYVDFAVNRVRMLLDFGVIPYLVFDGAPLPSKAGTNAERRKRRDEAKAAGLELYKAGKTSLAYLEFQKAADVTFPMVRRLIEELKRMNVQYIVAPYEADAQLAYLEHQGIINGVLSEDSDLLVFGVKCLLTKLNQYGECVEINRADFASCREVSLTGWTDAMFRRMAILSGCDYLPNISNMGLKTAYRFVRKYKDAEKVLRMIQYEGKFSVPATYLEQYKNAELTFLHHRVFCPIQQRTVLLTELDPGMKITDMLFLGPDMNADIAIGVACGDLNPKTKQPHHIRQTPTTRPQLSEQRRRTLASTADLKQKKPIDNFFRPRRQPLAELDPNSLTPSPSQQRLLQVHANASWEMRTISSAPQLRRSGTPLVSSGGSVPVAQMTDRAAFLAKASTLSTYQPPKRPRLCSEMEDCSPSRDVKQSPFFAGPAVAPSPLAQKKGRPRKARKSDFEVWSDDSTIDEVLAAVPDVQQAASPAGDVQTTSTDGYISAGNDDDELCFIPQSSPPHAVDAEVEGPLLLDSAQGSQDRPSQVHISQLKMSTSGMGEEHDNFEDLLQLHETSQRSTFLQTFVCQSPERRAAALASVTTSALSPEARLTIAATTVDSPAACGSARITESPLKTPESPAPHAKADERRTFASQSESVQMAALASLRRLQSPSTKLKLGIAAISASVSEKEAPADKQVSEDKDCKDDQSEKGIDDASSYGGHIFDSTDAVKSSARGSEDHIVPDTDDELSSVGGQTPSKGRLNLWGYAFMKS